MDPRDQHWHWLLVDSLARGMPWADGGSDAAKTLGAACSTANSCFDELQQQAKAAQAAHDSAGLVSVVEAMKSRIDTIEAEMSRTFHSFDKPVRLHIMRTPRFDISSTGFLEADVPDSIEDYLKTLPALATPFPEFWMEWTLRRQKDEKRDMRVTTQVSLGEARDDGSVTSSLNTFIHFDPDPDRKPLCLRYGAELDMGGDHKPLAVRIKTGGDPKTATTLIVPCIHAMALLSCRNVTTASVSPSRQLRRSTEREDGVALCSYQVIKIGNGKRYRQSGGRGKPSSHRALSICRGHFKTYDDHGLFGNRKGTWWWQDHVRGDYESGVVVKDYVVERSDDKTMEAAAREKETTVQ